jgi:hypothetical protein
VQDFVAVLLDVFAQAVEMCMDDGLGRSDGALGKEHASRRSPLAVKMVVHSAKGAEIGP